MRYLVAVMLTAAALGVSPAAAEDEAVTDIKARLAKYARVEVARDLPGLTQNEQAILRKFIAAAKLIDQAFWAQANADGLALRAELEEGTDELSRLRLRFLNINKGRFDRQADNEPFLGGSPKPAGAAFWPEDLTREELEAYVTAHPEEREGLYSLTTLVRRDGERLTTIPYRVAFEALLQPAAGLLREAADLSDNESLSRYLRLRADALVTDAYLESDLAWMDVAGNKLDIVIGAIEPYEDGLMNLKGAFEAFVLVKDEAASRELEAYIQAMDEMQQALPIDPQFKRRAVRLGSRVGVFTLVYASGDGEAGIKTIAISLPNDERVREAKGTRKIMLRNAVAAKYEKILVPIAGRLLAPDQLGLLDGDIFFSNILLHEVAHSLGNDFVLDAEGDKTERRIDEALKNHSAAIEECKADIAGLWSAEVLVSNGVIPADKQASVYATFLAGIFRSVRFGAASAHGVANAVELNWFLADEAITVGVDGRWRVDEAKFRESLRGLCRELLLIQYTGDYRRAAALIEKYGTLPESLQAGPAAQTDIPVDIEFVWK
jgi:hypothetical protein